MTLRNIFWNDSLDSFGVISMIFVEKSSDSFGTISIIFLGFFPLIFLECVHDVVRNDFHDLCGVISMIFGE